MPQGMRQMAGVEENLASFHYSQKEQGGWLVIAQAKPAGTVRMARKGRKQGTSRVTREWLPHDRPGRFLEAR